MSNQFQIVEFGYLESLQSLKIVELLPFQRNTTLKAILLPYKKIHHIWCFSIDTYKALLKMVY